MNGADTLAFGKRFLPPSTHKSGFRLSDGESKAAISIAFLIFFSLQKYPPPKILMKRITHPESLL
jgi:hypothetical protein